MIAIPRGGMSALAIAQGIRRHRSKSSHTSDPMPWSAANKKRTYNRDLTTSGERLKKAALRLSDERYRLFAVNDLSRKRVETNRKTLWTSIHQIR
jgi:hypothetical protein